MSVGMKITFETKPSKIKDLRFHVVRWSSELTYYGFALSQGLSIHAHGASGVSVVGHFVDKAAARAAITVTAHESVAEVFEDVQKLLSCKPTVEPIWVDGGIPTCRCGAKRPPPLNLWGTPMSEAPALLCSKGGTVPCYKYAITEQTWRRMRNWNKAVQSLGRLYFISGGGAPGFAPEISRVAKKMLHAKNGIVAKESKELARELSEQIGRKVQAFVPPVHIFKL